MIDVRAARVAKDEKLELKYDAVPSTKTEAHGASEPRLAKTRHTCRYQPSTTLTWKITYWAAPRKDAPVKAPRRVQRDEWRRAVAPCRLELIRDSE